MFLTEILKIPDCDFKGQWLREHYECYEHSYTMTKENRSTHDDNDKGDHHTRTFKHEDDHDDGHDEDKSTDDNIKSAKLLQTKPF